MGTKILWTGLTVVLVSQLFSERIILIAGVILMLVGVILLWAINKVK
jgi:uncharacterized protein YjeT (DUF2065 family)